MIYRENVMIYRENVWFNEKMYDLPRKCMIYRENWYDLLKNVWFNEKIYDLPRKCHDLSRKCHDLPIIRMTFWKFCFIVFIIFFNVFLIHMCIFKYVLFVWYFFHQNNCFVTFFLWKFLKSNILISYYKINFINIDIRFIFDMDIWFAFLPFIWFKLI